jgi:HIV-1 Vpr-binding protein
MLETFFKCNIQISLHTHQVKFSNSGDIIYAVALSTESEDDGESYGSSFKTFDAHDYSSIATIETKSVAFILVDQRSNDKMPIGKRSNDQLAS